MKKLLIAIMILGLGISLAYAGSDGHGQGVVITSDNTISITIPPAEIIYTLLDPQSLAAEQMPDAETSLSISFWSNAYALLPDEAYLTAQADSTSEYMNLRIDGVSITNDGVTGNPVFAMPAVLLSDTQPRNIVIQQGGPGSGVGTVGVTFNMFVVKQQSVPGGTAYSPTVTWTAYNSH